MGAREFAIFVLYAKIVVDIYSAKKTINIFNIIFAIPAAISFIQLLSITAIYIAGVPPLFPTVLRISIFESNSILIAIFCIQIQTSFAFMLTKTYVQQNAIWIIDNKFIYWILILLVSVVSCIGANFDQSIVLNGNYSSAIAENSSSTWGGWSLIYVVSTAFLLKELRSAVLYKNNIIILFVFLEILYFIIHGNRSEILIQAIIAIIYLYYNQKLFYNDLFINKTVSMMIFFIVLFFYFIGEFRDGVESSLSVARDGYLFFSTISGAMWSQIVTVHHFSAFGTEFGSTYLYYLINSIPSFIPTPWDRGHEIISLLPDSEIVGGVGFWGEAYINFGILGVYFFSLITFTLIRKVFVLAPVSRFAFVISLSISLYAPRFLLYDIVYLIKMTMLFLILYIFFIVLKTSLNKVYRRQGLI